MITYILYMLQLDTLVNKKHHLNCHFTSDELLQIAIKNQSITYNPFGLGEQDKCSDDWGHSASAGSMCDFHNFGLIFVGQCTVCLKG